MDQTPAPQDQAALERAKRMVRLNTIIWAIFPGAVWAIITSILLYNASLFHASLFSLTFSPAPGATFISPFPIVEIFITLYALSSYWGLIRKKMRPEKYGSRIIDYSAGTVTEVHGKDIEVQELGGKTIASHTSE